MKNIGFKSIMTFELKMARRSGWLRSFTVAFIAIGIIVIIFGTVSGTKNILSNYNNTTATLLNIALYIIPLFSLCIGSITISEENENGSMTVLLTYPVSFLQIILGKYLGLVVAFTGAIGSSLGLSIILMIVVGMYGSIKTYIVFALASFMLMMVYLAISILIGFCSKTRMQAIGWGLAVWFLSIIIYEPAITIVCLLIPHNYVLPVLTASILINPADMIRIISMLLMGNEAILGSEMKDFIGFSKEIIGILSYAVLFLAYMIAPNYLAHRFLRRVKK